jgi:hypothetical protein
MVVTVACGNTASSSPASSEHFKSGAGAGGRALGDSAAGATDEPSDAGAPSEGGSPSVHAQTGGATSTPDTGTGGTARPARGGSSNHASSGGTGGGGRVGGAAGQKSGSAGDGVATGNAAGGAAGDDVSGTAGERTSEGGAGDDAPNPLLVPGFSERKRLRPAPGLDFVLEEVLTSYLVADPPPTRLRRLTRELATRNAWQAPDGEYISDFCVHPSGAVSAVLVASERSVSLVRLDANLELLGTSTIHDPAVADDPHASDIGVTDLTTNPFAWDAARIGANGEAVFTVAVSEINAVIGYRLSFTSGTWSAPLRTLIEPPTGLTPNLPIGGSFDTFGAEAEWFRAPIDLDPDGNAYVALWANPTRIRSHKSAFADGVTPLPGDPDDPGTVDSDVLLTKLDADGNRLWTHVVGTEHEDEPYAVRATRDAVAVVGRSRRFPGFDNTVWDALVSVTSAAGDATETVTLALDASSILLGADARPAGGWIVAGSDGWLQNPDGLSILADGQKLLLELPSLTTTPIRRTLAAGPRHNELHSVIAEAEGIVFAGHEDGPLTHDGDGDLSAIHATGVLGVSSP